MDDCARDDFITTLSILLDGDGARTQGDAYKSRDKAIDEYIKRYRAFLPDKERDATLRDHLRYLEQSFDWLSLKGIHQSLQHISPKDENGKKKVDLVDLLSLLQVAIKDGTSVPTREIFPDEKKASKGMYYCNRKRLEGAQNIYRLFLFKLFKHSLRLKLKVYDPNEYERFFLNIYKHHTFIDTLDDFRKSCKRDNYLATIGFLTYNWDPVLPFLSIKACRDINSDLMRQSGKERCKRIYAEFGIPLPGVKFSGQFSDHSIHLIGEDTAFMVNSLTIDSYDKDKHPNVKSKFLLKDVKVFCPHGLVNLRICPRCHNGVFLYPKDMGEFKFQKDAPLIFLSDPVPSAFDLKKVSQMNKEGHLYKSYFKQVIPDLIVCPTCGGHVYFEHSFMDIQSALKPDKPAIVNKIHFDYADFFGKTEHIVSMGYSFPADDYINSIFLHTMRLLPEGEAKDLKDLKVTYCSHSKKENLQKKTWYSLDEAFCKLEGDSREKMDDTWRSLKKMVKRENIRINFHGFPKILQNTTVEDIMYWKKLT